MHVHETLALWKHQETLARADRARLAKQAHPSRPGAVLRAALRGALRKLDTPFLLVSGAERRRAAA